VRLIRQSRPYERRSVARAATRPEYGTWNIVAKQGTSSTELNAIAPTVFDADEHAPKRVPVAVDTRMTRDTA